LSVISRCHGFPSEVCPVLAHGAGARGLVSLSCFQEDFFTFVLKKGNFGGER